MTQQQDHAAALDAQRHRLIEWAQDADARGDREYAEQLRAVTAKSRGARARA